MQQRVSPILAGTLAGLFVAGATSAGTQNAQQQQQSQPALVSDPFEPAEHDPAQQDDGGAPQGQQLRNEIKTDASANPLLEGYDADGSGYVTPNEWPEAAPLKFNAIDTNGDGRVMAAELRNALARRQDIDAEPPNVTIVETEAGARLGRIDADNDGYITPREWSESGVQMNFGEVDTNRNGIVERSELVASRNPDRNRVVQNSDRNDGQNDGGNAAEPDPGDTRGSRRMQMLDDNLADGLQFSAYDTDGNGMLDRLEASDSPYLMASFDAWDVDGNDLLDPYEAEQGWLDVDMN